MTELEALMQRLTLQGIRLWPQDGKLRYAGPQHRITPDLLNQLRVHKSALLQRLCEPIYAPLSYGQRGLWFIHQHAPDNAAYNVSLGYRIHSALDVDLLCKTIQLLVNRHASLRTRFISLDDGHDELVQQIDGYQAAAIETIDATDWSETYWLEQVRSFHERPYDLSTGPLFRAAILKHDAQSYSLLLSTHHIVVDGWSIYQLIDELFTLYAALQRGMVAALPIIQHTYADYVAWQHQLLQTDEARLWSYWQEQLQGELPVLQLPTDYPRPPQQTLRGISQPIHLSTVLAEKLKQMAQQNGCTLYTVLLAAYQLFLHRYSGQEDILVGMPISGRSRPEFSEVIGYFTSPVVARADFRGNPTFANFLAHVKRQVFAALDHQDYPLARLVKQLNPQRDSSRSAIYQASFVLQKPQRIQDLLLQSNKSEHLGLVLEPIPIVLSEGQEDIALELMETPAGIVGHLKGDAGLFSNTTLERMAKHFVVLLEGIVSHPDQPVLQLPMLTEAEYHQIVHEWNECAASRGTVRDTAVGFGEPQTIHALFEQQVERTPDAVALVFPPSNVILNFVTELGEQGGAQLTYAELNARANQLAHHLIELGTQPDTLVAVAMERSIEMVVGLLAVLKAGGAYVPIDPAYPLERIAFILHDCGTQLILTESYLVNDLPEYNGQYVFVSSNSLRHYPSTNPTTLTKAHHLAYVIYTSGSTGQPKGALIEHQNVWRLFAATDKWFNFNASDVWTLFHSFAFDFSVWELWGALFYGGRLVIVSYHVSRDPRAFYKLVCTQGVTVLNQTPSAFRQLIPVVEQEQGTHALRYVIFGGEALEFESLRPWFALHGDVTPQLVNMYGITETTVHVTYQPIKATDLDRHRGRSRIGQAIPDLYLYILDAHTHPVPAGISGELHVGGAGLARGYLNRPELTAERFIEHPEFGRLYKTGDLCRWLPDGNIEFMGRTDFQVKIRGFRIELGEIENALLAQDGVREAVVLARDAERKPGNKRLVAYLVGDADGDTLRQQLAQRLPNYMLPLAFVQLPTMPLTPNGKLDRRALPAPDMSALLSQDTFVPPSTPIEIALATIWSEVLGLEKACPEHRRRISITDNFFEIGGDSILSIQIVSRARKAGIVLQARHIFEAKTIVELARLATTTNPGLTNTQVDQGLVTGSVPLLPIQVQYFENHVVNPHHFNQSFIYVVEREMERDILIQAICHLLQHHDALRLRYMQIEATWQQEHAAVSKIPITDNVRWVEEAPFDRLRTSQSCFCEIDLSHLALHEQQEALIEHNRVLQATLNITTGPLLRVVHFHLRPNQADKLLFIIHHLVVDWVSWRILIPDFWTIYDQLCQRQSVQLPAKTTSFKKWSEWLQEYAQSEALLAEMDYWLSQGAQSLASLPVDYPRQHEQATVHSAAVVTCTLSVAETQALLQDVPAVYHTQINDLLLTALVQSIAEWTGNPKLLIHLEGHGREALTDSLDLSRTVGWFTTLFPVCLHLESTEPSIAIKSIKEQLRQIPQKGIGYGLLRYLNPDTGPRLAALPQAEIVFNYGGQFRDVQMDSLGDEWDENEALEYRFNINGAIINDQLTFSWLYSQAVYKHETAKQLSQNFLVALQRLIDHCQSPDAGGYTPTDFPDLELTDQTKLDALLATINFAQNKIEAIYPLSPSQQGMLFDTLSSYRSDSQDVSTENKYIESFVYDIQGPLDVRVFQEAWQSVITRHPPLRSGFVWVGQAEPLQFVLQKVSPPLTYHDWRSISSEQQQIELERYLEEQYTIGFNLAKPPLMDIVLFHLNDELYRFIWRSHHILTDGWSNQIILHDLLTTYEAYKSGDGRQLPPVPSYQTYIRWLKQQEKSEAKPFWQDTLRGFMQATPLGSIQPPDKNDTPHPIPEESLAKFSRIGGSLSLEATKTLQTVVQQHSLTLNTLVRGVWASLLSRYSGHRDVIFGATIAGRPGEIEEVEAIVGLFINTIPIRVQVQTNRAFLSWLQQLQTEAIQLDKYGYCSSGEIHSWSDIPTSQPLFESILVFQNYPVSLSQASEASSAIKLIDVDWSGAKTPYALTIMIILVPELRIEIIFDTERFGESDIKHIVAHLQMQLGSIAKNPTQSLQTLIDQIPIEQIPQVKSTQQIRSVQGYVPPRTEQEQKLVKIWEEILGTYPVGIHDNFFDLGGHSLLATQLIAKIREVFSIELSLSTLFTTPTIAASAQILLQREQNQVLERVSQIFPELTPVPEQRHEPFPLTDVQHAYWVGRNAGFELGNVAAHSYYELDSSMLDVERLNRAWQRLIDRHEMLRAIIQPDGQQRILPSVPSYEFVLTDLADIDDTATQQVLETIRNEMSHQVLPAEQWPLFDIRVTRINPTHFRLHISLDILILDGTSMDILFREWITLYQNPQAVLPPLQVSFRDYVFAEKAFEESEHYKQAWGYWKKRLDTLPAAPKLPLQQDGQMIVQPRYQIYTFLLDSVQWQQLKVYGHRAGLTDSTIILAAFAEILAQWSKEAHFTLNLTLFNRLPFHPQINEIVGDFTPLLMLEVDNRTNNANDQSFNDSFLGRARRIQQQLWEDLDHRIVNGVRVLRELAKRQGSGANRALMPVVFTSMLATQFEGTLLESLGEPVYVNYQTPQVWLDHIVSELGGALDISWSVVQELFPDGMVDEMFDAYCALLQRLATDEKAWQEPYLALSSRQQQQREAVNATSAPISEEMLHTLFLQQVEAYATKPAVITPSKRLTYQELYQRANQVGHWLREQGAKPNTLVAVVMEKGWEQVVAVLGIHLSGAAYLPIDPNLPAERLHYLLEQGETTIALTQSRLDVELEWPEEVIRLAVDKLTPDASLPALDIVQTPTDLAYVIYTSGSTGLPKGVVIDHRGAVNTVLDVNQRDGITANDRVLALSALNFDLSVYDIFGLLAVGGAIVMPDAERRIDPEHWNELIHRHGVTVWNTVPALMQMLVDYTEGVTQLLSTTALRVVMMSGDWIPVTLPDRIRALWPAVKIVSMGGATEASIWSIYYPIEEVDPAWPSIPYGKPMTNQTFHVLDANLNPRPVWVPGDLYIGGIGLALGYWKDQQRTNASFITHPRTGERLYKTGDLGRYILSGEKDLGNIEFLGREDFQVKIRGHRIELGEIERTLLQHPTINEAVVNAVGDPKAPRQLVGYVVLDENQEMEAIQGATPEVNSWQKQLQHYLAQKLPDYMIPATIVTVASLPLTANGKVDRKALPIPDLSMVQTTDLTQSLPRTETERAIAEIWCELLGVEQVGIHDDFFALGGDSLIATQLRTRLRDCTQIDLPFRTFFASSTISRLAEEIDAHRVAFEMQSGIVNADQSSLKTESIEMNSMEEEIW